MTSPTAASGSGSRSARDAPGTSMDESRTLTSLSAINAQLIAHGWIKRPLNLANLHEKDQADLTNVLFELLGSSLTNLESLEEISARLRTLDYEHERLIKSHTHVKVSNGRLQTEVEGWKAKCVDVTKRLAVEEGKVKELREELGRGRKALEGVRVAAGHEAKKTQIKLDKAQAQLLKISNDASLLSRPQGLVIMNPIIPGKTAPVAPGQSPLLEQSLKDLAEIRQSLQEETEAFRHVVVSAGNGLREVLSVATGAEAPPRFMHSQFFSDTIQSSQSSSQHHQHQSASSTSHPSIADARLKSLIADVRTKMAAKLPPPVASLTASAELTEEEEEENRRIEREEEKIRKDLEDRVKDLEVEVICAKAREVEAKKVVEEMARTQMQAGPSKLEQLDSTERDELHRQKMALQSEKREFTKASARFTQERRQFELERQAFLAEQRKVDLEAVMSHIPPTPPPGAVSSDSAGSASASGSKSSSSSKSSDASSPPEISPPLSPFHRHLPLSPSPLSPHKRTPRAHHASKRKVKTPLSRLVLEKAVRQTHRESKEKEKERELGQSVLGEGGRRANAVPAGAASIGGHKDKAEGKDGHLKVSTLKGSTRVRDALTASTGPATRDLAKAEGVGPRATAKGGKAWR